MDTVSIVKALLTVFGDKQDVLAKELNVTQPTISRWLKGVDIKGKNREKLYRLAREKEVINDDPFGSVERQGADSHNYIPEIDLTGGLGGGGLSTVKATSRNGITFHREAVRDYWQLPEWMMRKFNAKAAHIAAFPVQGDSMEPTLKEGDVVFIDTRHRAPSPDGIYALADEFGGVIVKRLEVTSRPGDEIVNVSIISDNARHRARELTLPEINIIGRYVGRFTT